MQSLTLFLLSIRNWTHHPIQTLFTVMSIMVGVSLVVGIDSANTNAAQSFRASADALAHHATHRIESVGLGVHDTMYVALRTTFPALVVTPMIDGYGSLFTMSKRHQQSAHLLGIDALSYGRVQMGAPNQSQKTSPDTTQSSRSATSIMTALPPALFERFLRGDGLIISRTMATNLDVQTEHDSLAVMFDGVATPFAILAILADTPDLPHDIVLCDIRRAQEIFFHSKHHALPYIHRIDVSCTDALLLDSLQRWLPSGLTLTDQRATEKPFALMTSAFEMNLQALSMLALIVSMFITYNTMSFSALQRREEFGIMRVLGTDGRTIAWLILRETLLLSAIASLLGCVLGMIIANALTHIVSQTINDLYTTVGVTAHLQWRSVAKGCAVGILTSGIATLPTVWECSRIAPRTIVQRSVQSLSQRALLLLSGSGIVLMICAWCLLLWANHIIAGFVAILVLIVGASLLLPAIISVCVNILARSVFAQKALWITIALRGMRLGLQRFSIAIAALMVAVSMVIAITIMIVSFRETVNSWLLRTLDADIYISPPSMVARTATGIVQEPIVRAILAQRSVRSYNTFRSRPITLSSLSPQRKAQLVSLRLDRDSYQRYRFKESVQAPWQAWQDTNTVFLSEPLAQKTGLRTGDTLYLPTLQQHKAFRIAGVIYDYASDVGVVYINAEHYRRWWQDSTISGLSLKCAPDSIAPLIAISQSLAAQGGQTLLIRSNTALRMTSLEIFDSTFRITNVLRIFTLIVACMSIFSTLLAIQLERSHEHAIARALGMSAHDIRRNVLVQTACAGMIAGVCALPLGYYMAQILTEYINVRSFGWSLELQLDIPSILATLGIALLMALCAGLYPAYMASTVNVATALHEE